MGTKYSSVSISGFNASPPPDDGSTSSSNQLQWSKHISKIGNPLKTGVESVNSALVTTLNTSARLVTSDDSSVASDHWKTIQIGSTITASVTISLGDAATMAAGYIVTVANQSTVACVIGRATATDTINTYTNNVTLNGLESITFVVNSAATGYIAMSTARLTLQGSTLKSSGSYQWLCFAVSDETTSITTGTAKITFRLPACTVLAVRASLTAASSSGTPTVDINEGGTTILSTKLTIDANELTSTTAATPAVISDSSIADDALMTVDIDTAGTGAQGLKIYLQVVWN